MTGAVLKVENLCKSFGALPVSDAVNLEVKSGEIHAIIGPNGAGKSTLIGQIAGGLSPDTGSIFLNGQDITGLKMAHRAQLGLGRTFQISSLAMEMSVLENTILGAIGQRQDAHRFWSPVSRNAALGEIAMTALAAVGLGAHADQVVATLSHGQRRQLEVAVAGEVEQEFCCAHPGLCSPRAPDDSCESFVEAYDPVTSSLDTASAEFCRQTKYTVNGSGASFLDRGDLETRTICCDDEAVVPVDALPEADPDLETYKVISAHF